MADEQIVTNIVANADFSNLSSELRRVTAQLTALQDQANATNKALANQISVMNRQFGDTLRSTGQFTSHFVTIGSDVEKFGKNLDAGRGRLKDFYGAWQGYHKQAGGLIRDLARQQVQLQNSILQPLGRNADGMMKFAVHVPRGLDDIKNKTSLAKQELMIMNKVVQEGAGQLINWGKNTQWAGRQLTVGLTLPIAAFGKAAADAFRQADEELTRLTKVYGDLSQTSSAQLKQVRSDVAATARELAAGMGASYNQTLALSADIAATGKTGNELLGSIRETTRLSILGEVDRQEAMKATLAIQSAFKQNTDELSQSIDFLNAVENQTSTSLADLVEAIPKAGPVVKGLGGSIKDLALYLTAMREGGISASEGANALKSGLASLINPTNVAVSQFKSFGIDLLGIVNNNAGNVTQTLLDLQSALDTLDPLSKQKAIEQLFGKFQFSRMNALFENLGKQGSQTIKVLELMKASSADLADIAGRELTQVTESASGKYRRALEELKADLSATGEQFLKISTYVLKFVDKIVDFANNLPGPIKTLLGFFGGLTAIAGPLIMLTGVLGNFFGYIIKGVSHFRSLFKGAEGWKMLTPEILAASKAGDLAADTFYSDTKAAQVLNQALRDLTAQYDALATRAASGAVSVKPLLNNLSAQAAFGQRVVDPNNPLAGAMGTRASGHMVPRKVDQPRSIFGLVPTSIPVNAAIGENPMIYSEGDLPNVPGLTSISATRTIDGVKKIIPVSTGIVAGEAAKHHAYTAALAMQTKQEFEALKKTLAITGTASKEFIDLFDDILPITSQLTAKAATQSAGIVAELKAGKINVAQAREQIIALNVAIEKEMGAAVSQYAAGAGRSINLMNVPTLNQPVQSATGKSNMRELFKQRTGGVFNRLASALGVRTSGAGYNIQTTIPKRFNSGGYIYTANGGSIVPGPNVNADVVPAMLTPGEFVVNAKATAANLPLLQAINGSGASGNRLNAGSGNPLEGLQRGHISNDLSPFMLYMDTDTNQRMVRGRKYRGFDGITGYEIAQSLASLKKRTGMHPASLLDNLVRRIGGDPRYVEKMYRQILADLTSPENRNRVFGGTSGVSFEDLTEKHLLTLKDSKLSDGSNVYDTLKRVKVDRTGGKSKGLTLDGEKYGGANTLKDASGKSIMRALLGTSSGLRGKVINDLLNFAMGPDPDRRGASIESHGKRRTFLGMPLEKTPTGWGTFGTNARRFAEAMNSRMKFAPRLFKNKGGIVPGYNTGGQIASGPLMQNGEFVKNTSRTSSFDGSFGAGMGLQTAGYLAGQNENTQQFSTPLMLAGTAMQMAPMLKPMGKAMSSVKSFSGLFKSLGKIAMTAIRGIGMALRFLTGPIGLAITAVTILAGVFLKLKDNATKAGAANRLEFGGTKESFASVGIKTFKTLEDRMEEHIKKTELAKAKIASAYNSFTKVKGPTGLTLTIEQLDKAVANAKKNQKEYVEAFNNIDKSRVKNYAASLKAQFVGMGMSVSDATNQIYAIVQASDKASQSIAAISSNAFKAIKSQADGISFMIKALNKSLKISDSEASIQEFAVGFDTLLNSLYAYQEGLVGTKTKSGEIVDETDALKLALDKVVAIKGSDTELSREQLDNLKEQNILYGAILNKNETLASITAKTLLYNSGVGEIVDLSALAADEAMNLANNLKLVQDALNAVTLKTTDENPLAPLARLRNAAKKQSDESQAALKKLKAVDEDYYNKKIENHQKIIDKIQEETEARLKLLDVEQKRVDYEAELSDAKLRYEQALANGDLAQAAQEQLNINKIMSDRQRALTYQSIADKGAADVKAQQEIIKGLQDQLTEAKNGYSAATARATKDLASYQLYEDYMNKFEAIAIRNYGKTKLSQDDRKEMDVYLNEMIAAGGSLAKAAEAIQADYPGTTTTTLTPTGPVTKTTPGDWKQGLIDELIANSRTVSDGKFSTAVDEFSKAVAKFAGNTSSDKLIVNDLSGGQGTIRTASLKAAGEKTSVNSTFYDDNGVQWKITSVKNGTASVEKVLQQKENSSKATKIQVAEHIDDDGSMYGWVPKDELSKGKVKPTKSNQFVDDLGFSWYIYDGKFVKGFGYKVYPVLEKADGGFIKHFEPGGTVSGPGTATSDSIPAMLSNGEYVVKADSVKKYGIPFMDNLNAGKYAIGGAVPGYKDGSEGGIWSKIAHFGVKKLFERMTPSFFGYNVGYELGGGKELGNIVAGEGKKSDYISVGLSAIPGGGAATGAGKLTAKVAAKTAVGSRLIKAADDYKVLKGATHASWDANLSGKTLNPVGWKSNRSDALGRLNYFMSGHAGPIEGWAPNYYKPSATSVLKALSHKGLISETEWIQKFGKGANPGAYLDDSSVWQEFLKSGYTGIYKNLKNLDGSQGALTGEFGLNFPTKFKHLDPSTIIKPQIGPKITITNEELESLAVAAKRGIKNGGYINVPKFENGINMVPADMLAMLHKNEAVVPANMNPFNPNANNATMGGAQYNVNVTLNGSNMDANDVARVITRELKMREAMSGRSVTR